MRFACYGMKGTVWRLNDWGSFSDGAGEENLQAAPACFAIGAERANRRRPSVDRNTARV